MAVLGGITSIAQRRIRAKIFYNIFGNAKPAVKDASMTLTRHTVAALV
jgi:glutamate racemase